MLLYWLERLNQIAWGPGTILLFIGTGLFFLIMLHGLPWKKLLYALKLLFCPTLTRSETGMSPFQSAMTALGACMGTGNIVGVASAMVLGGPGALVWMSISAMIGLPVIFSECLLSIQYRKQDKDSYIGGPMYVMKYGIDGKFGLFMAVTFSIMTVCASFGIGNMTQSNSAAAALASLWHVPKHWTGAGFAIALMLVFALGQHSIGKLSALIVPVASAGYLLCAVFVIWIYRANLIQGISEIFKMAFSYKAIGGGAGGVVIKSAFDAMKWGVARGIFSNEAGLGSTPIAAAAAVSQSSKEQAYMHMAGAFFDTVIMCSVTGLAIAASGVLGTKDAAGHLLDGVALTMKAFECIPYQGGMIVIGLGMIFFAFSTLIGWAYYGENALRYFTKSNKAILTYHILFCVACYIGAVYQLQTVWLFADLTNVLMALPNMICLLMMARQVKKLAE